MTEDEMRAELAGELRSDCESCGDVDHVVESLLPTVRRIVAEELRAAADEQQAEHERYSGNTWGTHAGGHGCAADHIRARADALDPR